MSCTHQKTAIFAIGSDHVSEEVCSGCGAWRQIVLKPSYGDWQIPGKKRWYAKLSKATRKREFPKGWEGNQRRRR